MMIQIRMKGLCKTYKTLLQILDENDLKDMSDIAKVHFLDIVLRGK